ncbi:uncharacterized protein EI90DRAFT_3065597 [Cantharellus anzutake]|uniref:uncharacterized protein n=1 Tax=Cantharellus anzutake TaxID=1750568 RepID=UPI0019064644|nr:uncharacterized protein EI90DRAFT_3065597 [Cantharellus anzutake]KAF8328103.1 hypothetical protein EI90DRAFT_3065597 [Cantharellus anzutake]
MRYAPSLLACLATGNSFTLTSNLRKVRHTGLAECNISYRGQQLDVYIGSPKIAHYWQNVQRPQRGGLTLDL